MESVQDESTKNSHDSEQPLVVTEKQPPKRRMSRLKNNPQSSTSTGVRRNILKQPSEKAPQAKRRCSSRKIDKRLQPTQINEEGDEDSVPAWFLHFMEAQKREKEELETKWEQKFQNLTSVLLDNTTNAQSIANNDAIIPQQQIDAVVPVQIHTNSAPSDQLETVASTSTQPLLVTEPISAQHSQMNKDSAMDLRQMIWNLTQHAPIAPNKPRFDDKTHDNPVVFLRKLEDYAKELNISQERLLSLALCCLHGSPKTWTSIFKEQWSTYDDFKKDFLNVYWTRDKQRNLRYKIINDKYVPRQGTSMLAHFSKYTNQASFLNPPMSEDDLLSELVRHFPHNLQSQWLGRENKTIKGFAHFLVEQESISQNKGLFLERSATKSIPFQSTSKPLEQQHQRTFTPHTSGQHLTPKATTSAGKSNWVRNPVIAKPQHQKQQAQKQQIQGNGTSAKKRV